MSDLNRIGARMRRARASGRPLLLLLDYDGTLVDLKDRPGEARASGRHLAVLRSLSATPGVRVFMVSGRTASQLSRLLPVKGLAFFGAYGAQVKVPGGRVKWHPDIRPLRGLVSSVHRRLREELQEYVDLELEDKWGCVGIQTRMLSRFERRSVARRVRRGVSAADPRGMLQVTENAYGMEVGAQGVDKGRAVSEILSGWNGPRGGPFILYAGDDTSDEAAFRTLRSRGLTVCVGRRRKSAAQYRLSGPGEVLDLLESFLKSV